MKNLERDNISHVSGKKPLYLVLATQRIYFDKEKFKLLVPPFSGDDYLLFLLAEGGTATNSIFLLRLLTVFQSFFFVNRFLQLPKSQSVYQSYYVCYSALCFFFSSLDNGSINFQLPKKNKYFVARGIM